MTDEKEEREEHGYLQKKITRRKAISNAAAAGAIVAVGIIAGAGGYFAGTSAAGPAQTVTSTVTGAATTVTKTVTATASPTTPTTTPPGEKPPFPLVFVHWHYQDAIITSYVKQFEEAFNEWVVEETLDNAQYNTLLENKFIAGDKFDMNYQNADAAHRLVYLGFCKDIEDMPGIAEIKSNLYDSIISAYSTIEGKLSGLPYFVSVRSATTANDAALEKYGMAGEYPKSWDGLWDIGYKLKDKGMDTPILPHWFAVWYGIVWDLEAELLGINKDPEGTKVYFGKDFHPAFDTSSGPLYELLKTWKKVHDDGVIDPVALTWGGDGPMITAFNSGAYAFNPTAIYYFWAANDPEASEIAGKATLVPPGDDLTGVIDTGLYQRPVNNSGDDARQLRLIKWFGYKDHRGEYLTAKSWFKSDLLNSGYKPVIELQEVQDAIRARMGDKTPQTLEALNAHIARMATPWCYKSPLYPEWKAEVGSVILPGIVTGDIPIEQGLTTMRDSAEELWKQYHG